MSVTAALFAEQDQTKDLLESVRPSMKRRPPPPKARRAPSRSSGVAKLSPAKGDNPFGNLEYKRSITSRPYASSSLPLS